MSWREHPHCRVVVAVCLLASCSEKPMAPGRGDSPAGPSLAGHPAPPGGPPTIPDSMRSWFAERGITLPAEIPAHPAGPTTIPAAMRAWFAERGVQLPASLPPVPAAKATSDDGRLLGDGFVDGKVDYLDLWGLWPT